MKPKQKKTDATPMASSVVMTSVDELLPYIANARTHSADQVKRIAASIKEFGFNNPILIDGAKGIIAGHGRLEAARKLKLTHVPTIELSHLSDAQKRAYILADNRLALDAGWDDAILSEELKRLQEDAFDVSLTGFSQEELDKLLGAISPTEGLTDEDAVPDAAPAVCQRGQVWKLGRHRLMCGDSTSADDIGTLMEGNKAEMLYTDPPYGVEYDSTWRDEINLAKSGDAAAAFRGSIKNDNIVDWSASFAIVNAPIAYVWHASLFTPEIALGMRAAGYDLRNLIVWVKTHAFDRSHYHHRHEPCWYGIEQGATAAWCGDRKQTTVWECVSPLAPFGQKEEADKVRTKHPTQKPVVLALTALKNHAVTNVVDLFGGSGSTLIACEKTGRTCFMMELDEKYCDVIIARFEAFTGQKAELVG